jgi:hypothetical protein
VKHCIFFSGWILALASAQVATQSMRVTTTRDSQIASIPLDHDINDTGQPFVIVEEVLRGSGLPAGVAQTEPCSVSATAHLRVNRGTTVREALDTFVSSNLEYRWLADGDVINLVPTNGSPLLDTMIRTFELSTTDQQMTAQAALSNLIRLPEVHQRAAELQLKAGIMQGGPGVYDAHPVPRKPVQIHITLTNIPLREAFNSVVRAFGHTIWVYRERECVGGRTYVVETQAD